MASRWMPTRRSFLSAAAAAAFLPLVRQQVLVQQTASVTARDSPRSPVAAWDPAEGILISGATVVTMDAGHSVIRNGQVLVRSGRIAAVWQGSRPLVVDLGNPSIIEAGPDDLLFPGLINLHDHPGEDFLYLVLPPSSDAIAADGKSGTDPYANRYQWRDPGTMPPEFARLLTNPVGVLVAPSGLGLETEVLLYAQIGALLGGETATQGAPVNPASDNAIIRSIDNGAFNSRIGPPWVDATVDFTGPELTQFVSALKAAHTTPGWSTSPKASATRTAAQAIPSPPARSSRRCEIRAC